MLVFSMIVSFRINSTIAWIFLTVIPIMALLLLLIIKKVNPIFNRVFHTYDELNNIVQENVRAIRVVKSFNHEDYEIDKFKGISKSIYNDFAKGERLLAFNSPMMNALGYMQYVIIAILGSFMGIYGITNLGLTGTGTLTLGMIASFLTLSRSFTNPVHRFQISLILLSPPLQALPASSHLWMKSLKLMTAM